jgi:GTP-binding protein EngB required for normal cell division
MAEIEALLAQGEVPSPFSQYVNDLSPTEAKVVRDYFGRLRATMQTCLQEAGIPLEVRRTGMRWACLVNLIGLHIAVAEMGPERLRGYGPLSDAGRAQAATVQQELNRLIDRVGAYLRQGLGRDLPARLARLEATSPGAATLAALDRVITRRGLVEFRPLLDQVVRRLEAPQFEIAVFGRVSSGKSSLLNHVAGLDVLPVGVTPITAVPTRMVRGDPPSLTVWRAETGPHVLGVEHLREYASEEGNPGNRKHVTGILVKVPSPRLREGVALVDTPGVGSLARSGSAETFAYLPQCDLGIVLIDSASTLTPDDLSLLRLLYEAAVPAQVLLSKADLLRPADRQRTVEYVREQVRQGLGLELPVHPVSTVGADEALLTRWFEQEVEPLLARHRALVWASLRRKVAHLRESVIAALETLLARQRAGTADGQPRPDPQAARRMLDAGDAAIRQSQGRCQDWAADGRALLEIILHDAASAVVSPSGAHAGSGGEAVAAVVGRVLAERGRMAHDLLAGLQRTLADTLEALEGLAPLGRPETASIRGLAFRGLPTPELPAWVRLRASRPWWASLSPRLAVRATRRALEARLGPALRELVELHDRQVQACLRACLGQLVEQYEAQAEVFREQARRGAGESASPSAGEARELEADLQELRQTEAGDAEAVSTLAPGGRDHPSA